MNITLVYFVYGLAFFSMGLIMAIEANRSPLLADAKILRPLAVFGLVHGSHEWFEMFVNMGGFVDMPNSTWVGWLRIVILSFSFFALLIFAWRSFKPVKVFAWCYWLPWGILIGLYIIIFLAFAYLTSLVHSDFLIHLDGFVRLLLAVPAAILAALAFNVQGNRLQEPLRADLGNTLRWVSLAFLIYGLTQIFIPGADFFPANLINSTNFRLWTGVPVQFIRAILAVIVTLNLLRASHFIEKERQEQFRAVQQGRIDAVEQLRLELDEREAMRQDLMRHIVIAQEDERARIARELHDETSQILTGFSLHLAALRDILPNEEKIQKQISQLQIMSKQIAQSLYNLVHDLRPAQLDDLGLAAALNFLVDDANNRFKLKVQLQIKGLPRRLDKLIETVIFRTAQEGLTNVARHARTHEADMQLKFLPDTIELTVADRGVGFDPNSRTTRPCGYGLAGMRERAASVGGKLLIQSSPGQGATIQIVIPSSPATAGQDEIDRRHTDQ